DGRTVSFGKSRKALRRNAPTIMNAAFAPNLFWDGRANGLESQAAAVLLNPDEMHSSESLVVERLSAIPEYRDAFNTVFGDAPISMLTATQAIAAFERTVVGGRSRFDAFLRGNHTALSDESILGLDLFRTKARCIHCHNGPTFTDHQFHDVGLSYFGRAQEDLGRFRVTEKIEDVGRFKTPSLRNVAATAPYMHNGLFELDAVLNLYNAGMPNLTPKPEQMADPRCPKKSPLLKPLGLNKQDLADLKAFLESLTEPNARVRPPELPGATAAAKAE
ncbi:MAG: cytochrome-c peroxidase, partial [Planctomycetia bacterium]